MDKRSPPITAKYSQIKFQAIKFNWRQRGTIYCIRFHMIWEEEIYVICVQTKVSWKSISRMENLTFEEELRLWGTAGLTRHSDRAQRHNCCWVELAHTTVLRHSGFFVSINSTQYQSKMYSSLCEVFFCLFVFDDALYYLLCVNLVSVIATRRFEGFTIRKSHRNTKSNTIEVSLFTR